MFPSSSLEAFAGILKDLYSSPTEAELFYDRLKQFTGRSVFGMFFGAQFSYGYIIGPGKKPLALQSTILNRLDSGFLYTQGIGDLLEAHRTFKESSSGPLETLQKEMAARP